MTRDKQKRRRILRASGALLAGSSLAGCSNSQPKDGEGSTTSTTTTTTAKQSIDPSRVSLKKLDQLYPSAQPPPSSPKPSGGYSEVDVRDDGRYAVLGTKWGVDGSYLFDITDPSTLKQVHYLPNEDDAPTIDVKFDHRNGLYYRAIERTWPGNFEVVDYGYSAGKPTEPTVIGTVSDGKSHNVEPHPRKSVLYTMNYQLETNGFDVYDVTDPSSPRKLGEYGPQGAGHDINVDPEREVLCCAYQSGKFIGLVLYDVSDPRNPKEISRFDYRKRNPYNQAKVGEQAFGSAHHGHFDPRRDLLVIGDERTSGVPGGKHVFDVGWKNGSLADPIPVGFTVSPNARRMGDEFAERFDWTGHHFNVVPWGDATFVVAADWHDGVVAYDITDPTNPHPVDRYPTDDGTQANAPNDKVSLLGEPPMAWKAAYDDSRDRKLIVGSDTFTGIYTFELTAG
ncbi:LVIVD repeat-containing protein [Halomicrococcus sp. NG-SE-24]|uniref:LVIVD repeat-containing protein n=1 Tax=Halomicrococcus sp. NG-SE-24 TaxID=3436928 RepID=UPI003D974F5B